MHRSRSSNIPRHGSHVISMLHKCICFFVVFFFTWLLEAEYGLQFNFYTARHNTMLPLDQSLENNNKNTQLLPWQKGGSEIIKAASTVSKVSVRCATERRRFNSRHHHSVRLPARCPDRPPHWTHSSHHNISERPKQNFTWGFNLKQTTLIRINAKRSRSEFIVYLKKLWMFFLVCEEPKAKLD